VRRGFICRNLRSQWGSCDCLQSRRFALAEQVEAIKILKACPLEVLTDTPIIKKRCRDLRSHWGSRGLRAKERSGRAGREVRSGGEGRGHQIFFIIRSWIFRDGWRAERGLPVTVGGWRGVTAGRAERGGWWAGHKRRAIRSR